MWPRQICHAKIESNFVNCAEAAIEIIGNLGERFFKTFSVKISNDTLVVSLFGLGGGG